MAGDRPSVAVGEAPGRPSRFRRGEEHPQRGPFGFGGEKFGDVAPARLARGPAEDALRGRVPGDDAEIGVAADRGEGSLVEEAMEGASDGTFAPGRALEQGQLVVALQQVGGELQDAAQGGPVAIGAGILRVDLTEEVANAARRRLAGSQVSVELPTQTRVHLIPAGCRDLAVSRLSNLASMRPRHSDLIPPSSGRHVPGW